MTTKQIKVYEFIKSFALEHNYAPTYEEIVKKSGIYKSKQSVHEAMNALAENGYVTICPGGKNRAYSIKGLQFVEV